MFCHDRETSASKARYSVATTRGNLPRPGVTALDAARERVNTVLTTVAAGGLAGPALPRTSEILRDILTKNPGVKAFSVERILASIGTDRFEASLMMFSIPAILPIPGPMGITAIPTGAIGSQLATGEKQIKLPRFVLKKCISRRALAVAIHATLPALEAAEKILRPRWNWVNHSSTRRALGIFIMLLALALAFPILGFSSLHATSIFVMALGMAEQDGLAVLIGVAVGIVSLAVLTASGMSARALRSKAVRWLRKVGKRAGLRAFAYFLRQRGYVRLARLFNLEWSKLLLLWDAEKSAEARLSRRSVSRAVGSPKALLPTLSQAASV
jgi:hypothetical protein